MSSTGDLIIDRPVTPHIELFSIGRTLYQVWVIGAKTLLEFEFISPDDIEILAQVVRYDDDCWSYNGESTVELRTIIVHLIKYFVRRIDDLPVDAHMLSLDIIGLRLLGTILGVPVSIVR